MWIFFRYQPYQSVIQSVIQHLRLEPCPICGYNLHNRLRGSSGLYWLISDTTIAFSNLCPCYITGTTLSIKYIIKSLSRPVWKSVYLPAPLQEMLTIIKQNWYRKQIIVFWTMCNPILIISWFLIRFDQLSRLSCDK